MTTIERPGVDQKWSKNWNSVLRNRTEGQSLHEPLNLKYLEYYVQHGITQAQREDSTIIEINPPHKNWEEYLDSYLAMYADMRFFEFEMHGMQGTPFDVALARRAFAPAYTHEMIDLQLHNKFPIRFPGRILQMMSYTTLPFTALGVVIGCKEEAFRLARMQLLAYRKGYYLTKHHYPIFQFIFRILADYLNEPPHVLEGESLKDPIFNALFALWREPDADALVPVCLAACDFHTHRCKPGDKTHFYEFENGLWTRTPIEILLLFKLRQLLGLQNPQLDHPLMNTPLGVLPEETAFEPDDLIKQVRARMMQDGYDEQQIYEAFMAG